MSGAVERRDASHTPDIDERLGSARRVPRDRVFENNHPLLPLVIAIVPLIRTWRASATGKEGRKEGRKTGRQEGRKGGGTTLTWHFMLPRCTVLGLTCFEQKRATPSDTYLKCTHCCQHHRQSLQKQSSPLVWVDPGEDLSASLPHEPTRIHKEDE